MPILKLTREMREIKPNIVQTHTFPAAVVGRAAARAVGIPVIVDTLHNTYSWKQPRDLRIDRMLGKITNRVVCVSNAVRDFAIEQNPKIPAEKFEVIYNGVDTGRYHPRSNRAETLERFGINPESLVVGSVSRLVRQKRVADLVAAAPRVLDQFSNTHFLIAGDGPAAAALKDEIRVNGLESKFTFTGTVYDTENLYPACDVYAQMADREGFGLSMAEAMASGTAVIAANAGAIPEIVHHGQSGLLYEAGNLQGLSDGICTLLGDMEKRTALGAQARHDIETKFNIQAVPENYRNLWNRLLREAAV